MTTITFRPNPPVDAMRIIELVQKNRHIKLAGNDKLRIERDAPEPKDRAQLVRDVLRSLGTPKARRKPASSEPRDARDGERDRVAPGLVVRGFAPPLRLADFGLIAFDMDSTLITSSASTRSPTSAGKKAEVAAITEAAMRGEIADYKESLRRRVALLQGRAGSRRCRRSTTSGCASTRRRARSSPRCKAAGLKTLLVSGGFTFFTDRVRDRLGIDFTRSNVLEIDGRRADRPHGRPALGRHLRRRREAQACCSRPARGSASHPAQAIAVGDGANDLPMMATAGLARLPRQADGARAGGDRDHEGGLDRLLDVLLS